MLEYLGIFDEIGMDIHFGAHLHYYQRTMELCWDRVKNDYYVTSENDKEKKVENDKKGEKEEVNRKVNVTVKDRVDAKEQVVEV